MKINKLLTPYNLEKRASRKISYIVIHYVGALGGAEANCRYYASKNVGASAHYYVGFEGEVWQSVEDNNIAWHCGAKKYIHTNCRNANSIGVEMCVRKRNTSTMYASDKDWFFEPATIASTIDLVRELMEKYDIPVENVIRHYDVTSKVCPAPYVHNKKDWDAFKSALVGKAPIKEKDTNVENVNKSVDVIAKEVIQGKWGNGSARKEQLTKAGYDYATIQKRVNELLGSTKTSTSATPKLKSIDTVAKEVIKGLWGNGSARKQKLTKAGYDYAKVQKRVNEMLRQRAEK